MLTISSALAAAARSPRRRPAVRVNVTADRFTIPVLELQTLADTSGDADAALSLCIDPTQETEMVAIRNNGGSLDRQHQYPNTG
ncbi:MAG: hypothetical protein ABI577_12905, partial [bacterium]